MPAYQMHQLRSRRPVQVCWGRQENTTKAMHEVGVGKKDRTTRGPQDNQTGPVAAAAATAAGLRQMAKAPLGMRSGFMASALCSSPSSVWLSYMSRPSALMLAPAGTAPPPAPPAAAVLLRARDMAVPKDSRGLFAWAWQRMDGEGGGVGEGEGRGGGGSVAEAGLRRGGERSGGRCLSWPATRSSSGRSLSTATPPPQVGRWWRQAKTRSCCRPGAMQWLAGSI